MSSSTIPSKRGKEIKEHLEGVNTEAWFVIYQHYIKGKEESEHMAD